MTQVSLQAKLSRAIASLSRLGKSKRLESVGQLSIGIEEEEEKKSSSADAQVYSCWFACEQSIVRSLTVCK